MLHCVRSQTTTFSSLQDNQFNWFLYHTVYCVYCVISAIPSPVISRTTVCQCLTKQHANTMCTRRMTQLWNVQFMVRWENNGAVCRSEVGGHPDVIPQLLPTRKHCLLCWLEQLPDTENKILIQINFHVNIEINQTFLCDLLFTSLGITKGIWGNNANNPDDVIRHA